MTFDRAVGFAVLRGVDDRQAAAARGALDRLLAHMPWLRVAEEHAGTARLVVWGHGDVATAMRRDADGGLVAAIGDAPPGSAGDVQPSQGVPWEGRGVAVRVAPDGREVEAAVDWTGSIPVFHAAAGPALIVSSLEPMVVEGLDLGPVDFDRVGLVSLLVHGYFLGDRTLFGSMRLLRPDHAARWSPEGHAERPLGTLTPSQERWSAGWDDLAEEMAAGFRRAIRRTLAGAPRWVLPLSGGIDSRLIAAVAAEDGVDLTAVSYGPAGWSDVIYARRLARRLGIPWRRVDLDDRYLADFTPLWADWFGSALHFHGMYQMPFLTSVRDVDRRIATGFTGDPLGGAQTEGMAAGDRPMAQRLSDKWHVWTREQLRRLLRDDPTDAFAALDEELDRQWAELVGEDYQRTWLIFQSNHVARFSSYQPLMYDYWKGVGTPFVDRELAAFTLSLPRVALEGRRLQALMIRRHFPAVATVPDTHHLGPIASSRAHLARAALAAVVPRGLRRGPLREFNPVANTQDQDAARAGGTAAVWPLFESLEALREHVDVDMVLAEHRAALAGDLTSITRIEAIQALAFRLAGVPHPHDRRGMSAWLHLAGDPAARPDDGRWLVFAGDVALLPGTARPHAPALDAELSEAIASGFAVANLEAPIAGAGAPAPKAGPTIATHDATPTWLREAGFDAVSLANNHAMDHGWKALRDTAAACERHGLRTVGAGADAATALEPLRVDVGGRAVAIFAVCEREFGVAADGEPGVGWISAPDLERRIAAARAEHDLVVVCAHGGNEEVRIPSAQRRAQLRRVVEAGADVVIGHHPHVAQGWERWGDGFIFHSLGDFCFDSGLAHGAGAEPGYVVRVSADGPQAGLALLPYVRDATSLRVAADPALARRLTRLAELIGDDAFDGLWQEVAVRLWEERYAPFVAAAANTADPHGVYFRLARLKARLGGRHRALPTAREAARDRSLLLLLLLRCESHRWAMETAQEVLAGAGLDRRTAATRRLADELR